VEWERNTLWQNSVQLLLEAGVIIDIDISGLVISILAEGIYLGSDHIE